MTAQNERHTTRKNDNKDVCVQGLLYSGATLYQYYSIPLCAKPIFTSESQHMFVSPVTWANVMAIHIPCIYCQCLVSHLWVSRMPKIQGGIQRASKTARVFVLYTDNFCTGRINVVWPSFLYFCYTSERLLVWSIISVTRRRVRLSSHWILEISFLISTRRYSCTRTLAYWLKGRLKTR